MAIFSGTGLGVVPGRQLVLGSLGTFRFFREMYYEKPDATHDAQ